ncbi:MAG: SDR family oxidoreductase [Dehalococcoidia bacterium]
MELDIKDRVALVGGSSRGMGKATALAFAREGVKVTICARHEEELHQAEREVASAAGSPDRVLAVPADLSRYSDIQRVVQETLARFGRIDILVNNVGGPPPGGPLEVNEAQWHLAIEQTLMASVRMSREVASHMKEQRWGRIINLLSTSIREPVRNLSLSTSLRMAVAGFARMLCHELAPYNITVNNVLSGMMRTERLLSLHQTWAQQMGIGVEEELETSAQRIPMKRIGRPEEMADLILFLASERAAFISGASIPIDGGALQATL